MSDLLHLAQTVVAQAGPGEQIEAFAVHAVSTSVSVFEQEIEKLSSSETRGVGVRVVIDRRLGFASTSDVSADGLAYAVAEARSNAALATQDVGNVLPQPSPVEDLPGIFVAGLAEVPMSRKVELALALERATTGRDLRVRGVDNAAYGDGVTHAAVASSLGVAAFYSRTDAYAWVSALARDRDETQTGLGLTMARSFDDLDIDAAAVDAVRRSTRLLGARKAATAKVPVVFDPLVTASFLGVLASPLTAEAAQKGRSLFAEKVGLQVAAPTLALVDDGRLLEGPAASPFDDEGVPTRRTEIIAGGVLQGFLHNTQTAARAGGDQRSTGNAARAGHKSSPGISPSNLFFDGAQVPAESIVASIADGLYVQDVAGIHSGANPVSGEFSVGATGMWIRDGELAEPVREVTVSSTIVDILTGITALGDDRRFFPFGGALAGQTMLIAEMTVAGA
ncbi:MAG: TldD/PmbA family protein [Mycobacteriales bacterium]